MTDLQSVAPLPETPTPYGVYDNADSDVAPRVALNPADPDLARVVEAWPDLPGALRRAVLALIGSTTS